MDPKEKRKKSQDAAAPSTQSSPRQGDMYGHNSGVPEWPTDLNPPGGFLRFLQNPQHHPVNYPFPQYYGNTQQFPENFHFTGATSSSIPFSPPQPMPPAMTPPAPMTDSSIGGATSSKKKAQIQLDVEDLNDGEAVRKEKRLQWTEEEETRLVSCWLNCSNDPIDGNCKKLEQYWEEVAAAYNSTTPKNRRREIAQLKIHFHRMKTKITNFNGCWKILNDVYQSGMSDDQRRDNAMKKYRVDYREPFKLYEVWKILRNEPKWRAYVKRTENNNSSVGEKDKNFVDLENIGRPIGCKAAKAERKGKRKKTEVPDAIIVIGETIDKLVDATASSRQDREKLTEVQQRLSAEKLETARINKESKMLDVYKELLLADTCAMDDDAKAQRAVALDSLKGSLFGKKN